MSAYYNEHDPKAAAWLRELIKQGELNDGEVDERDIRDVCPNDLGGFTECHFFAGIGVWARAVRDTQLAEGKIVWTGSCPCQPFSAAGERKGVDDERHLWPDWFWLIRQCRPDIVLGEQVGGKNGYAWFDLVSHDMEGEGYAIGAADTPACGYGAPHIRNRLYFVGLADADGRNGGAKRKQRGRQFGFQSEGGCADRMADAERHGRNRREQRGTDGRAESANCCSNVGLAKSNNTEWRANDTGRNDRIRNDAGRKKGSSDVAERRKDDRPGPLNGFWRDADWIFCRDNKWRPVKSALEPLAHGIAGRVGLLRGAGNALVYPQAKAFCEIVSEI